MATHKLAEYSVCNCSGQSCFVHRNGVTDLNEIRNEDSKVIIFQVK